MSADNECLITGCDLFDKAQNRFRHGDLFVHEGVFIFNSVCDSNNKPLPWVYGPLTALGARHVVAHNPFERRGVIIFRAHPSFLSAEARAYVGGTWA